MSEASDNSAGEEGKEQTRKVDMRTVPIEFFIPDDLPIPYADNFNLFFSDYDFTLTFLQTQAPLIMQDADWEKAESVKAKGVSRVVVPPHLIPRIVNVLTENWQRFLITRQKQIEEQKDVNATAITETVNSSGDES